MKYLQQLSESHSALCYNIVGLGLYHAIR